MVLTPLVGFWLASSLAAYQNATQWLALLVGLLLFPLIPVGWELFYAWRRTKQEIPRKQILTRIDRLVLRTLIVNGAFLIVMLWFGRTTAFRSVSMRGDWMFDGHDGPIATKIRSVLLAIGDRLDKRREPDDDRFGSSDEAPDPTKVKPRREPTPTPTAGTTPPKDASGWPYPDEADTKIANMPLTAQASIDSVGAYIKEQFPDRKQRVKALHDYVALRLSYDTEGLAKSKAGTAPRPSQLPADVFASKLAVCEGYARLMVAIGAAASVEVKYVTGWIRDSERRLAATDDTAKEGLQGYLHAWNAVLVDDEWFLVDATWDDSEDSDKPIRSNYLFTPPQLFAYDHLPEDPAWQLVVKPISLGDFARQPFMSPALGRLGLTLESPTRSQITVRGTATLELANPYDAEVVAVARPDNGRRGSGRENRCEISTLAKKTTVTCELDDGEYQITVFAKSAGASGSYQHVGSILANSH
ncbi:MAG: transglutaminase domain-containing protein [Kofleriaceae bacterium]